MQRAGSRLGGTRRACRFRAGVVGSFRAESVQRKRLRTKNLFGTVIFIFMAEVHQNVQQPNNSKKFKIIFQVKARSVLFLPFCFVNGKVREGSILLPFFFCFTSLQQHRGMEPCRGTCTACSANTTHCRQRSAIVRGHTRRFVEAGHQLQRTEFSAFGASKWVHLSPSAFRVMAGLAANSLLKFNDGTLVPRIGFGVYQIRGKKCSAAVAEALKARQDFADFSRSVVDRACATTSAPQYRRDMCFAIL